MSRSIPAGGVVFAALLSFAVIAIGLLIVVNFLAVDRIEIVQHGWDETLGSWDEIMARYPATGANGAALELERRAAALGLDLAPRFTGRAPAAPEAQRAFLQLKKQVFGRYAFAQLERVRRGDVDPPPALLGEYMDTYAKELEALRGHLLQGGVPVWESDLSKLSAAPIPNLLGHIDLQKALVSVALAQIHDGDTDGALQSIEAGWNLSRSLRDSPVLISQLIYFSGTRLQIGALRHIRDLPPGWTRRLTEHDFRRSFVEAMKFEGWHWVFLNETSNLGAPEPRWWRDWAKSLMRPYTELCLADVSDSWRRRVARLEQVGVLCDRDLSAEGADLDLQVPRWNMLGDMVIPNLASAVDRVSRLELDLELLLLAAEVDATRRPTGTWPSAGTAGRSSSCPDDRWVYTPSAEGLEIALSREIAWPGQTGAILPQRLIID